MAYMPHALKIGNQSKVTSSQSTYITNTYIILRIPSPSHGEKHRSHQRLPLTCTLLLEHFPCPSQANKHSNLSLDSDWRVNTEQMSSSSYHPLEDSTVQPQ